MWCISKSSAGLPAGPSREMMKTVCRLAARSAGSLFGLALIVLPALGQEGYPEDYPEERGRIWEQADDAVFKYMERSVMCLAKGHHLAIEGFRRWYYVEHVPSLDTETAAEKVVKYVLGGLVASAAESVPGGGLFVEMVDDFWSSTYSDIAASVSPFESTEAFFADLNLKLALRKKTFLTLPWRFEESEPNAFEDAMWTYLDEELETAQIHENSVYKLGEKTRAKLSDLGFPEPSDQTVNQVAEQILIPLVLHAKRADHPMSRRILDDSQLAVDARISARRTLHPHDPDYYCEGAWELGFLKPNDCR